jgi:hypothetical protein
LTTIAWDGHTLAADKGCWERGTKRRVTKVFKFTRNGFPALVAFMGAQPFSNVLLQWLRGEIDAPDCTQYGVGKDECAAIIIDHHKTVWELSSTLVWSQFEEDIFARGGGSEYAWGALEAGATADGAIRIATKRSDYAAFGVDAVTLT